MAKEETKQEILKILVSTNEPSTLAYLAEEMGVSTKSIRNYLDELERDGILGDLKLVKKPNVGVYFEEDKMKRAELQRRMNIGSPKFDTLSPEARRQYILKTLFKNRYTYTIQLLADDLYVSKSTIVQDLVWVQKWLEKHGLLLQRKPNRGLWIEGDEYIFRQAMLELFSEAQNDEVQIDEQEIEKLDYRIDFINYKKILKIFPKLDIFRIQIILQQAETKLDYFLTDEAFMNLIIHIAITIERIKQERKITMEENQLNKLAETSEFVVAQWIVDQLKDYFAIPVSSAEVGYVSLHLLGARVQQKIKINNYEDLLASENQDFIILAKKIIGVVSEILDIDLSKDKLLLVGLALHLRPTVVRIRYGMKLQNPLLERIKNEYTSVFGAAWASSNIFEKMFGVTINEDEVGYIAMHIGAAIERLQRKIKTVVICASGVGTAQLVAVRLERELPELEIVEITSANRLDDELIDSVDIIVSTVALREKHEKVVLISTLVDFKDSCIIREAIKRRFQNINNDASREILADLLDEEYCFIDANLNNQEEIIRFYGQGLEKDGFVREGFVEQALKREELTSTSVGKGLAIPHASDEYIIKPKICVIKFPNPIDWGDVKVDLVFLLALKFQDGKTTKSFFKNFYSILDNEMVLNKIRKVETSNEILEVILGKDEL